MLNPNNYQRLSTEQVKQILDRGYSYAEVNGVVIKITKDDLVFDKEEVIKSIEEYTRD